MEPSPALEATQLRGGFVTATICLKFRWRSFANSEYRSRASMPKHFLTPSRKEPTNINISAKTSADRAETMKAITISTASYQAANFFNFVVNC